MRAAAGCSSPETDFAGVAQLVEREPSKFAVAGSIPVARSNVMPYGWIDA